MISHLPGRNTGIRRERKTEIREKLLKKLNKNIESQVLNNFPHGFGIQGDWAKDVDQWLDKIYE